MADLSASETEDEKLPILEKRDENDNEPGERTKQHSDGCTYLYIFVFFASLGGFLFGYATGVVSGVMIPLKRVLKLSILLQQIVVSAAIVGAVCGAWLSGKLNEMFGRRAVLLLSSALFTVGSLVEGLANGIVMVIVGRLTNGVAIGFTAMTVPVYIAEISPPQMRGKLVTAYNFSGTTGQFIASVMNGAFSYLYMNGWRFMLGVSAVPGIIMFVGCWFAPDSPRWLIQNDRVEDARQVLKSVRRVKNVNSELNEIRRAVAEEVRMPMTTALMKMLSKKTTRRALLLGCGLQMFQQLSAINTVKYYSASIIQLAGVKNENTIVWLAAVVAFGSCLFETIAFLVVERVGRRKLTLASVFGIFLALLTLTATFYFLDHNTPRVTSKSSQNTTTQCDNYSTCSSCIRNPACGFCYATTSDSEITNAACLAQNMGTSSCNISLFTNNRNVTVNWSTDICPSQHAWLAVCALIFYLAMFTPGFGPMPWVINAEIYPLWARHAGTAASIATNKITNLCASLTFLSLMDYLTRPGVFLMYAGVTLVGFVFLYVLLPETKGRKLEDIEQLFQSKKGSN